MDLLGHLKFVRQISSKIGTTGGFRKIILQKSVNYTLIATCQQPFRRKIIVTIFHQGLLDVILACQSIVRICYGVWILQEIFETIADKTWVPTMTHSATARPTVPPVLLTWEFFVLRDFEKWRTDGRTPRAKTVIITGHDCGSVSWINWVV